MSVQQVLDFLSGNERTFLCTKSEWNTADWTNQEIDAINEAARTNKSLTGLRLSPHHLTIASVEPFETLLECSSSITRLTISFLRKRYVQEDDERFILEFTEREMTEHRMILSRLLFAATKNKTQRITSFHLYTDDGRSFDAMDNFLTSCPTLKEFKVNYFEHPLYLDDKAAWVLGQILLRMKFLERVFLMIQGEGVVELLQTFEILPYILKELEIRIRGEREYSEALRLTSSECKVEELKIISHRNREVTAQFPVIPDDSTLQSLCVSDIAFVPNMRFCPNSTLRELSLCHCWFTEEDISVSLASLIGLKELYLEDVTMPGAAFALPASVEKVTFTSSHGFGAHVLASLQPLQNLRALLLLNHGGETLADDAHVWNLLPRLPSLEVLTLDNGSGGIFNIIRNAPRTLKLESTEVTDGWLSQVHEALVGSRVRVFHLTESDDDENGSISFLQSNLAVAISTGELPLTGFRADLYCSLDGIAAFFAGLSGNMELEKLELDLAGKVEKREDAEAIVAALKVNETITELKIGFESCVEAYGKMAEHLVSMNRYGRKLLRASEDSVPLGLWAGILSRVADDGEHSVLFEFLRTKSDLIRPKGTGRKRRSPGESTS